MNSMKNLYVLIVFFVFNSSLVGQNSSVGASVSVVNFHAAESINSLGFQYEANIRSQFTNWIGWQTEVGYASFDKVLYTEERISGINGQIIETIEEERSSDFVFLRTSVCHKLFDHNGVYGELITGGGIIKTDYNRKVRGLGHIGMFISAKVTDKLVIGIPVSIDIITWDRDVFYSAGVSIRRHF